MYMGDKEEAAGMCPYWSRSPGTKSLFLIADSVLCPSVLLQCIHRLSHHMLIASQMRQEAPLPSFPALTPFPDSSLSRYSQSKPLLRPTNASRQLS